MTTLRLNMLSEVRKLLRNPSCILAVAAKSLRAVLNMEARQLPGSFISPLMDLVFMMRQPIVEVVMVFLERVSFRYSETMGSHDCRQKIRIHRCTVLYKDVLLR